MNRTQANGVKMHYEFDDDAYRTVFDSFRQPLHCQYQPNAGP